MYTSSCEKTKIDVLECYLKVTRVHRGLNRTVARFAKYKTKLNIPCGTKREIENQEL